MTKKLYLLVLCLSVFFLKRSLLAQCAPSVSIQVANGNECANNNYYLLATPNNGGTSPIYEWKKNGVSIYTGTNPTFAGHGLINGDTVTCVMTSNADCANPLTASAIHVTYYFKAIFPTILTVSPSDTVSSGSDVTFTANVNNHPAPNVSILYGLEFYINNAHAPYYIYNSSGQTTASTVPFTINTLKDKDRVFCTTMVHQIGNPCADIDTSNVIVMSVSSVLPITLSSFEITPLAEKLLLNWVTSMESNSSHFIIQMSDDGIRFDSIGRVKAIGNSNSVQSYSFEYIPSFNSLSYFRLKMFNNDGTFIYSPIKSINYHDGIKLKISPNPARDVINVNAIGIKQIKLYDISGKLILSKPTFTNSTFVDVSKLLRGVYILCLCTENNEIISKKIVLQ